MANDGKCQLFIKHLPETFNNSQVVLALDVQEFKLSQNRLEFCSWLLVLWITFLCLQVLREEMPSFLEAVCQDVDRVQQCAGDNELFVSLRWQMMRFSFLPMSH